jgi:hypothetical protein
LFPLVSRVIGVKGVRIAIMRRRGKMFRAKHLETFAKGFGLVGTFPSVKPPKPHAHPLASIRH